MANIAKRSFFNIHFSVLWQKLVKASKISNQSLERAKAQYNALFDVLENNVIQFKYSNKENDQLYW